MRGSWRATWGRLLLPGCWEASSAAAWEAESGPSSRQSTDAFGRMSFPGFLLALFALGDLVHYSSTTVYLAVHSSVFGCCLWNTVHWILREMTLSVGAMLGSTVNTGFATALGFWTKFAHFLR